MAWVRGRPGSDTSLGGRGRRDPPPRGSGPLGLSAKPLQGSSNTAVRPTLPHHGTPARGCESSAGEGGGWLVRLRRAWRQREMRVQLGFKTNRVYGRVTMRFAFPMLLYLTGPLSSSWGDRRKRRGCLASSALVTSCPSIRYGNPTTGRRGSRCTASRQMRSARCQSKFWNSCDCGCERTQGFALQQQRAFSSGARLAEEPSF